MQKKLLAGALLLLLGAGCSSATTVDTTADTATDDGAVTNTLPALGEEGEGVEEIVVEGEAVGGGAVIDENAGTTVEVELDSGTETSIQIFTVTGSNFAFSPSTMTVKKGDTVQVTFVNSDGFHDFVIDEFGAKTTRLQSGASETISFVADKAGTFEYYCSVGEHRAMGMKGTLTVTE